MDDTSLGRTAVIRDSIDTGTSKPLWQPPRRIPPHFQKEVSDLIQTMLTTGIIRPSKSPWASPVTLVPKKDGKLLFCIDYRRLNAVTTRDSFPLPRIDVTLEALAGAQWFSTLDLKSGYWQVEEEPKDRPKTAFILPQGLFEFETMPFGLCNAAATFQRLMQSVLAHLYPHSCLIYLDDVTVFGRTAQQHNANLAAVLSALRDAGLRLNPQKCKFLCRKVTFLGHEVSPQGIQASQEKLEAVRSWPTSKTPTEVRGFLGLASYYRRFILHFAELARPLHRLTEKGRSFTWSDDCQQAFYELKAKLTSAPILMLPDTSPEAPPFILDSDASGSIGQCSHIEAGTYSPPSETNPHTMNTMRLTEGTATAHAVSTMITDAGDVVDRPEGDILDVKPSEVNTSGQANVVVVEAGDGEAYNTADATVTKAEAMATEEDSVMAAIFGRLRLYQPKYSLKVVDEEEVGMERGRSIGDCSNIEAGTYSPPSETNPHTMNTMRLTEGTATAPAVSTMITDAGDVVDRPEGDILDVEPSEVNTSGQANDVVVEAGDGEAYNAADAIVTKAEAIVTEEDSGE
nr:unnamed protein product [Spirometra erinaceieuropaei]